MAPLIVVESVPLVSLFLHDSLLYRVAVKTILAEPTVFAASTGPLPDKLTHGGIYITTLPDCGALRAPEPARL